MLPHRWLHLVSAPAELLPKERRADQPSGATRPGRASGSSRGRGMPPRITAVSWAVLLTGAGLLIAACSGAASSSGSGLPSGPSSTGLMPNPGFAAVAGMTYTARVRAVSQNGIATSPGAARAMLKSEITRWGQVVRDNNIHSD